MRFDRSSPADEVAGRPVIDAAQRFVARGGTWESANSLSVVAIKAVAHKLARASYHVLKDGTTFDAAKAFG